MKPSSVFPIIAIIIIIVTFYILKPYSYSKDLIIGKKYLFYYEKDIDLDNPFSTYNIDTIKVIDIKNGYMLYDQIEYNTLSENNLYTYENISRSIDDLRFMIHEIPNETY